MFASPISLAIVHIATFRSSNMVAEDQKPDIMNVDECGYHDFTADDD